MKSKSKKNKSGACDCVLCKRMAKQKYLSMFMRKGKI